ncbi:MAG TPA: 3-hydroxyacyl-CoA dehydrogenase NAD-binding domain-containing protein [Desulfobacterales bacterium]|jgi:3-hydroxybutyryl-CoA dehydrogenase|nr:3-hydroxyacyl-CoA dehydrogenase NAD-binding domain-containing protein [Desulfobacterales bacterium]
MTIKKVLVVGSGVMGAGIGQLCAQQGFDAVISDINQELANKAKSNIEKGLSRRVAKGRITEEDKNAILFRISTAGDLSPASKADFVIESASENLEIKKNIFKELDTRVQPEVVLATNTTSLSISAMAEATTRPEKVVQMHFFNPPTIMKLVEIIPGRKTAAETLEAAEAFAKQLGKDPVVCKNEAPAGIVSRILGQMLNEATWLVASNVAEPANVDKAMKLGANHPMGPLELIDLIGLDVHRTKMETLFKELGDFRYKHPELLNKMIEEGKLGKKTGRGFYNYGDK